MNTNKIETANQIYLMAIDGVDREEIRAILTEYETTQILDYLAWKFKQTGIRGMPDELLIQAWQKGAVE